MATFYVKGVLDRFGSIEWILFAEGGLARPIAVLADYEITQLRDQMREQRDDLEALRRRSPVAS